MTRDHNFKYGNNDKKDLKSNLSMIQTILSMIHTS